MMDHTVRLPSQKKTVRNVAWPRAICKGIGGARVRLCCKTCATPGRRERSAPRPCTRTRRAFRQRRRHRGSNENHVPRHVDPEEEQRNNGEGSVDDLERRKLRNVQPEPVFGDLESQCGKQAAPE